MKPYQALIWNEWRHLRGNVLVLAAVTAQLWLLLLVVSYSNKILMEYIEMIATALATGLPLLYSVVLADSLAQEFSGKSENALPEPPANPTKIFCCKYGANLAVFLALSAAAVLIMSPMVSQDIDLTSGMYSIDKHLPYRQILLLPGMVFLLWTPVHGMVLLVSLSGVKHGGGIVALIVMPLLCLMLLPGVMAASMLFIVSDYNWIFPSLLITFILLYIFSLGFGWYLWARRIVRGKRTLKPVIAALSVILIVPWTLYGAAYFYFSRSFDAAVSEARAAGLETDSSKPAPPPVPAEQNSAPGILEFGNEYKLVHQLYFGKNAAPGKKAPGPLPSHESYAGPSWTGPGPAANFNRRYRREVLSRKAVLEISDFIINDPRMNQCSLILAEALKKPYSRFDAADKYRALYLNAYTAAANFLSDRAYAFRAYGREDDFFACLAGIDQLADALLEQPSAHFKECGLRLKMIEYQTAVTAGPDTPGAVKSYNEMIRRADAVNPAMPDETYRIFSYLENDEADSVSRICKLFYLPRQFQSAAAWLRWKIRHEKLLRQASACASIKAVEPAINSLEAVEDGIPGVFRTEGGEKISSYFVSRERFESYKLCLALKVYHIKYARFPDELQQLVPEILPRIAVNPLTGSNYIYLADAESFRLSGYPRSGIRYQPWKIEPEKAK